jgi:hypothetical protein
VDHVERHEFLTNFLDCIAFLLVTQDLYGRKKVTDLSERLQNAPKPALNLRAFWTSGPSIAFFGIAKMIAISAVFIGLLVAPVLGFMDIGFFVVVKPAAAHSSFAQHLWASAEIYIFFNAFCEIGGLVLACLLSALAYIPWVVGKALAFLFRVIARPFPLEGEMLTAGAVIFGLARTIAIWPEVTDYGARFIAFLHRHV